MKNNTDKQAITFYSSKLNILSIFLWNFIILEWIIYYKRSQIVKSTFLLILFCAFLLYFIIEIIKIKKNPQYITLDNDTLITKKYNKLLNNDLEITKYEDINYVKISSLNDREISKYIAVYRCFYLNLDKHKNIFIYKKNGSIIKCLEVNHREWLVPILKSKWVKVCFGNN